MNNVLLTGNLTRDAEILEFQSSERKAIKLTLAVNRRYKNADGTKEADFIPVIYFTNYAHKLISYLTKGRSISISGKLSIRSVNKDDGTKRYYTDVVADNIDFLGSNTAKAL
jgi:single-strand DNA-binding protein